MRSIERMRYKLLRSALLFCHRVLEEGWERDMIRSVHIRLETPHICTIELYA